MVKSGTVHQTDKDSNGRVSNLCKESVTGQCLVPRFIEVPEKDNIEGSHGIELVKQIVEETGKYAIPTAIPIDSNYQGTTCNDAELTAQKSRKRMKDKAQAKVINETEDLVPVNTREKSASCVGIVGVNDTFGKGIGSVGKKTKLPTVVPEVDESSFNPPNEFGLPQMVLCLAHEGEVAWDVKWQPYNEDIWNQHRLGFLAVLLGDGSMQVWEVPLPSAVNFLFTSSNARGGLDPQFLKLEPVFKCSKLQSGGRQSIPLALEWSTSSPHDLLLAGCYDGMIALRKLSPKASSSQDSLPIRALEWAPNEGDKERKNLIVTGGHGGSLRFWDFSASIFRDGVLVASEGSRQKVELRAMKLILIGSSDPATFPVQKKKTSREYLRNCEDSGQQFCVTSLVPCSQDDAGSPINKIPNTKDGFIDWSQDFWGKPEFLTVSEQLKAETYASALSDMIEPELAFANLHGDMACATAYLQ
eukprot:Gb_00076 [translate_table: standard]